MALSKLPRQLQSSQTLSIVYHDIFDFPLSGKELEKWCCNFQFSISNFQTNTKIKKYKNYYFLKDRQDLIKLRLQREKYSKQKFQIAKKAAIALNKIPTIKFVGITGSLAMNNARQDSDIDLMIITSQGLLWTTRLITYTLLKFFGFQIRRPGDRDECDKLCLNMWMDESDLYFDKQNLFTAHELAQIKPLVSKDKTYERLISINNWIFDYWPRAVARRYLIYETGNKIMSHNSYFLSLVEKMSMLFQLRYMKSKQTREFVSSTRALFHPFDWGEKVLDKLF